MSAALNYIDPYCQFKAPEPVHFSKAYDPEEISLVNGSRATNRFILPIPNAKVACGLFGIHDDYIEKFQSLDTKFIKNKASTYLFRATSNSMEPLIFEGDILIVDCSVDFSNQKVAIINLDGEMICKRVIKKANKVILKSDNPAHKDIHITEEMDFSIFGVVTGIAREIV